MTRRAAKGILGLLGAICAVAAGIWILRESPEAPSPSTAAAPPSAAPSAPGPPPPDPPPPPPSVPASPAKAEDPTAPQEYEPSGLDPEDLQYPEGARGPVVVGVVSMPWDPDPEADVALESVDDPSREDPSEIESLERGGYRLVGLAPGRYRVRARAVGAVAVYSRPFEAKDGVVVDAGLLRLRRPGSIGGVVLSPAGEYTEADVRLFGRDPFTLVPSIVEKVTATGRQGFQLKPHEAGPFRLSAVGSSGYAVVEGRSDREGLAWAEVRLRPWGRVEVALSRGAGDGSRILGTVLERLEAPDLGEFGPLRKFDRGGTIDRVPAGRYRLAVTWAGGGGGESSRVETGEVAVAEGGEARFEVPPPPAPAAAK